MVRISTIFGTVLLNLKEKARLLLILFAALFVKSVGYEIAA